MDKKAQITWFMIIGIILLFLAGIFFFYARTILENVPETRAGDLEPVNAYIANCIDQTASRALELAGKQGGYIFQSQGGLVKDFKDEHKGSFFMPYKEERTQITYKVPYAIRKRERDYLIYKANPPEYPWVGFPGSPPNYKGIFGDSDLPPLYKKDGPFSIQAEIEIYIKNNLLQCLDFSVFRDYQITAPSSPEEIKTSLVIAKNDIRISVECPVQVSMGFETRQLTDFNVRKSMRLKEVYDFTENLIKWDNTDITFDIEKSSGGIYSDRKEDIYSKDDIIIVKDQNSLLGNRPYEFWFARQNRPPAFNPSGDHQDPDEDALTPPSGGTEVSDGPYTDS
jgi:hypothetical protein